MSSIFLIGLGALALLALYLFLRTSRRASDKRDSDHADEHAADVTVDHGDAHKGHSHSLPAGETEVLAPEAGDFDSVHKGKAAYRGCKFDPDEVRRTRNFVGPKIDLSNLPPVNPVVQAALAAVDENRIREHMLRLSGELPLMVGGKSIKIATRSTHHGDLQHALAYIVEQYQALGIAARRVPYKVRGKQLENIEAVIPGKTNPDKVVVIGSHLDSTAGRPWSVEAQAPGADDDGSGTVGVLELARAIKDMGLPYTVRILHFTGEEQGLWGSYAYSDLVAAAKTDVVAMVQVDMIGYCGKPGNRVDIHDGADKNGSHSIAVAFFRAIARYGINLKPVDTHNHAVDDRSDHAGFLDHGYKAVLISEEFTDDGFNPNYHQLSDRVKNCNLPYMVEVVKAIIALTVDLAGGK
ncbi:MAG: Zn-dependent exopeptidase M28 [Candidatus Obscuribacter phosphatis]|uniref:Zn-dependent exopeptidase M28 n=1 Tax=Candidatus Obscuribacter phosphatis TaxID=1906157 RepID=A0A8J7PEI4_9BACT|nr:Zn-dependent exopeptidase M28 [Candidatus Obscuribacter phosphatis]